MFCPSCNAHVNDAATDCPACQVNFAKWEARRQRIASGADVAPVADGESALPIMAILRFLVGLVVAGAMIWWINNGRRTVREINRFGAGIKAGGEDALRHQPQH